MTGNPGPNSLIYKRASSTIPGNGEYSFNTTSFTTAGAIRFTYSSIQGYSGVPFPTANATAWVDAIEVGDRIQVYDVEDPTNFGIYEVSSSVYPTYNISLISGNGNTTTGKLYTISYNKRGLIDTTVQKLRWENDQSSSYTLTAGVDKNTIVFFNSGNSFDSPGTGATKDIVVTLDPNTSVLGINRNFRLILGNGGRVETGVTWSVAYSGTRLVEYGEGRVEPHILDFLWNPANTEYLLAKYMLEQPIDDFETTGSAAGRDFVWTKRMIGLFSNSAISDGQGAGSSTVFPKGSILFVNETFVTCEGMTTPNPSGITVSFGLVTGTTSGSYNGTWWDNNEIVFNESLTPYGITSSQVMLFQRDLGDFATGSVFYTNSKVGIIRLSEPAMIVMKVNGGNISANTLIKCSVPYIVDESSFNTIDGISFVSGTNEGLIGPQGPTGPTNLINVGTGAEVYVTGSEDPAEFRTILVGEGLTIQQTSTEIIISKEFSIGPDTYIYIKLDSTSLGTAVRSQFYNLKETALKTTLQDFFATGDTEREGNTDTSTNGSDRYDNQVIVQDEGFETFLTIVRPNVGGLTIDPFPASASNVITLYYIDEIASRYTFNNTTPILDSYQTLNFQSDITDIKNTINSFSSDYLKGFVFNVTTGNHIALDSLMNHLNLNSGSYSGVYGLDFESDGITPRPDRFGLKMITGIVNPSDTLVPSSIPSAPGVWPAEDIDSINSTSYDSYEGYFLHTLISALNQGGSEIEIKGELKEGPINNTPYLDIKNNIIV